MRRRFFRDVWPRVRAGSGRDVVGPPASLGRRPQLPQRLSDVNFWKLSADWSEANGYFRSDNLTSNELLFQNVVGDLVKRTRPGRADPGVGPEQNYTYMAAVRPAMAIIFDIRRGNLDLQRLQGALRAGVGSGRLRLDVVRQAEARRPHVQVDRRPDLLGVFGVADERDVVSTNAQGHRRQPDAHARVSRARR